MKRLLLPLLRLPGISSLWHAFRRSRMASREAALASPYRSRLDFLPSLGADRVSFGAAADLLGADILQATRIVGRRIPLKGMRVLVVGCGKGEEVDFWLKAGAGSVDAFDYFDFKEDWARRSGPRTRFFQHDLRNGDLSGSYDLITSKAVLEHLTDFRNDFPKLMRVLRPGGWFWSDFGPLFPCWGGGHNSLAWDHLLLGKDEFLRRHKLLAKGDANHEETIQFWEHDLFSRLRFDEYLAAFDSVLRKTYLGVEISLEAVRALEADGALEARLAALGHSYKDLVTKSIFYLGRKSGDAP